MFRRALKVLVKNPGVAYIEREAEGEIRKGDEDRSFGVGWTRTQAVIPLTRRNMKKASVRPIVSLSLFV
jgi:predicted Ser/Thr protein kinase